MKKILFIYGFGGSPKSTFCTLIREALPQEEYQVICESYPQEDATAARDYLHKLIEQEQVDMVMGTSLGGFLTLSLDTTLPRVVINPCMKPSFELPLLEPRKDHPEDKKPSQAMIDTYKVYEEGVNQGAYNNSPKIIGLFAKEDTTLKGDYKKPFKAYYDNARIIPGGHHGNKEAIPDIIKAIKDVMKPILYIDMDNTLADFGGYVDNNLSDDLKEKYKDNKDEIPGIFSQFGVVEGAKEALEVLKQKYDLYILSTSPWKNPTALQDKLNWLKLNFGDMFHKHVVFTHQKNLNIVPGAWLVDDRPNHGAYRFGEHWLFFGKEGKYKTWKAVQEYLMQQV